MTFRRLVRPVLSAVALAAPLALHAQTQTPPANEQVVDPKVDRREVKLVLLDLDGHFKAAATSESLAERGCTVFHVTPRAALGGEIPAISLYGVNQRLRSRGVRVMVSSRVGRIAADGVRIDDAFSGASEMLADIAAVVVAAPYRAEASLASALQGHVPEIHVIGDAAAPRRALEAMGEGHRAGAAV